MAIRVLIADDDSLIRESLKIILTMYDDIQVIGAVENGLEALDACIKEEVDVALLDVRMPVLNGVDGVKEIVKNTKTKCLILTTFDEDEYIVNGIKNGAKGYILKNNSPDKIIDAIRTVYKGNTVFQDVVMNKIKELIEDKKEIKLDEENFTAREIEVIKAVAEGLSNKEVAQKLYISEGTVKNYITSILDKTGLEHRTQIAVSYLKGNI